MSSILITILIWIAALSSGLMAGIYFAFSGIIMRAFDNIGTSHAVAAMNSINEGILRSWFMPLFFGSSIVTALLAILAVVYWGEAGSAYALMAGMSYFVGMFVCTIVFNVPLNNLLAKQDPDSDEAKQVWPHYLQTWTRWNHLRTVCSLATFVLSVRLLSVY